MGISGISQRLADRLTAVQRTRFVGRVAELELFRAAIAEPHPPFAVLHVYGPGGIGKTTLLSEYQRIAQNREIPMIYLDGRNVDPSPPGFLDALSLALGGVPNPVAALSRLERVVLLIDTYEILAPLDRWLRDQFLPQLPDASLMVIAGRDLPHPGWRTTPGWRDLTRIVSLRNLHPEESQQYLQKRSIPQNQHAAVLRFTHGHPLALALVADTLSQSAAEIEFHPKQAPDVVRVLLEQFTQHIPSPEHQKALEICAHVRVTTEALLAFVFGPEAGRELFQWLAGLSFINHNAEGILPHDVVREVLDTDLRWRNPDKYHAIHHQVRTYIVPRCQQLSGREQQLAFFDLLYLHRHSPLMQNLYQWDSMGSAYAEPATAEDHPAILAMIEKHEGAESKAIVAHWLAIQPQAFVIFRSPTERTVGFVCTLSIAQLSDEERAVDPLVAAAWDYVLRHAGPRPGDIVLYDRFWAGKYEYRDPAVMPLVSMNSMWHWLTHPRLFWSFVAGTARDEADYERWHGMFSYLRFQRIAEVDRAVGGITYAVWMRDWRSETVGDWLDHMARHELDIHLQLADLEQMRPTHLVALSQAEFEDSVRQALRDYPHPDLLAHSPLLRSRLMQQIEGDSASPAALQALIREAAESLHASAKTEKFYLALLYTYLKPAQTQEAAAELLDLPFSTYRRHLTTGIARVSEWLWQRELYGSER